MFLDRLPRWLDGFHGLDVEGRRWRARKANDSLPEAVEAEEKFDLLGADEGADGFHGALAAGTLERVAAPDLENVRRMDQSGKPLYAYTWLCYHNSNKKLKSRELDDFLVEAMAVIPYFYGAKAQVLWGWEPKPDSKGPYYRQLPLFMKSLQRVARFSESISRAERMPERPVHEAWKEKAPLVQRLKLADDEWLVLLANPWQGDEASSKVSLKLGQRELSLQVDGRHTEIYHVKGDGVERVAIGH